MNIYTPRSEDSTQDCQQSPRLSVKPRRMADSVAQGVLQGAQLKQRKKHLDFTNNKSCNVLREPSDRLGTKKTKSQNRKNKESFTTIYNGYILDPNTSSTSGKYYSKSSGTASPETRSSKVSSRRCPLRIAELAEPTKRQCMQTWRNREGTLPGFMLEKLRQQIMNQKIVANIPDAIHCFQIQPKSAKHSTTGTKNARSGKPTKWELETANYMKTLCAVFAHNIAKKLVKPKKIALTDDLQNLGNIVATEIKKLISNNNIHNVEYVNDPKLLHEMSNKVAFWVAGILKAAELKILEDELRAKKREENLKGKEDNLATLMERLYIRHRSNGYGDLEEEEGPALDAIDTLVNNVMSVCLPRIDSDDDSYDKEEDSETRDVYEDSIIELREFNTNSQTSDQSEHNTDESDDSDSDMNKTLTEKQSLDKIPDIGSIYDISPQLKGEEHSAKYYSSSENGDENLNNNVSDDLVKFEESLDDRKKVKFTNVDTDAPERREGSVGDRESRQLGERGERSDEDGESRRRGETDGGSGSVDGSDRTTRPGGISAGEEVRESGSSSPIWRPEKGSFDVESKSSTPSLSRIRSDMIFQPPNISLLSIVDELWPVDLYSSSLKPSASVSKSITSLGQISEYDEIAEFNSKTSARVSRSISSLGLINEKEESSLIKNNKTGASRSISSLEEIKEIDESSLKISFPFVGKFDIDDSIEKIIVPRVSQPKLNNIDLSGTHLLIDEEIRKKVEELITYLTQPRESRQFQQIDDANEITSNESSETFKDAGKGDHIDTENNNLSDGSGIDKKQVLEVIKNSLKHDKINESVPKFDYKVHPQTAPAWAITSPSDESDRPISTPKKRNKGTCELHRWCRDLEHTLGNLDQWNNWLQMICKDVMLLKQQTDVDIMFEPMDRNNDLKEWIKLKKRIDKDAVLWRKLNKRTFEVLQNYHRPITSQSEGERFGKPLRKKKKRSSLCDAMYTIEGLSLWLHRSIVSTEHCIKCNCNDIKRRTTNVNNTCPTRSLKFN